MVGLCDSSVVLILIVGNVGYIWLMMWLIVSIQCGMLCFGVSVGFDSMRFVSLWLWVGVCLIVQSVVIVLFMLCFIRNSGVLLCVVLVISVFVLFRQLLKCLIYMCLLGDWLCLCRLIVSMLMLVVFSWLVSVVQWFVCLVRLCISVIVVCGGVVLLLVGQWYDVSLSLFVVCSWFMCGVGVDLVVVGVVVGVVVIFIWCVFCLLVGVLDYRCGFFVWVQLCFFNFVWL